MARRTAEEAADTRRQLLEVGRRLFLEKGYAGVSAEELVREAGVTRGAMYHHFDDKRELLEEVYLEELARVHDEVAKATRDARDRTDDPWEIFLAGVRRYLDLCLEPDSLRIPLVEAPAALGWQRWHELDRANSVHQLVGTLQGLMDKGLMKQGHAKALAEVIVGAANQSGRVIAFSDDKAAARREVGAAFESLLEGLRTTR